MKPLDSYKTWTQIIRDLGKEKVYIEGTYLYQYIDGIWWNRRSISMVSETDTFCCAIPVIGDFILNPILDKYWPYLIKFYLLRYKKKFLRCSTTQNKEFKPINDALLANGFIPMHQIKSNHGRYKVYLWEYWK